MTPAVNPEAGRFLLLQLSPTLARWGFKLLCLSVSSKTLAAASFYC